MYKLLTLMCLTGMLCTCGCALVTHPGGLAPLHTTKQGRAYTHHISGIIHERNTNLDRAVSSYAAVIDYDPQAVTPRLRLIRAYLRLGEDLKAFSVCTEALKQVPDSPELWLALGELHHKQNNMDEAVEAFKRAIELRPDNLAGYGALVEIQEESNDLIAVIDIYERLIARSPASAALYYQLGINLTRIGDHAGARRAFEKVLELEPRVTRIHFLLALVFFEQQDFAKSTEHLRLYLLERPTDIHALEYLAGCQYRLGHVVEAVHLFETLLLQNDALPHHYLQYSWVLLNTGTMDLAQQYALESGAYFWADLLFALSLFEKPEEGAWPTNPWDDRYTLDEIETETDMILGALPGLFGIQETCQTLINRMAVLRENIGFSPILEFFCARLLLHNDKYGEALAIFDALRARGTNSKHIHYHSAVASEKKNAFSDTEFHLRAFLEIEPDNAEVLNFLGFLYADYNRNLDEAERLLKRALSMDPENPYYLDSLGWVYYRKGKGEKAARFVQRALYSMDGDDAVLRDHLGDIYLLLGQKERAVTEWRHALRLDPSLEGVEQKINVHTLSEK